MGFDGPAFELPKLALEHKGLRFTYYQGWNLWMTAGINAWWRALNDVQTRGQLRLLCLALGIPLQEQST